MKNEFAKIFKMPDGGMVLVSTDFMPNEESSYIVGMSTKMDGGMRVTQNLHFDSIEGQSNGYEMISQQVAENFYRDHMK